MYAAYAEPSDYEVYGNGGIPDDELENSLRAASRHIDSLTFNRIIGCGFDNLTPFQHEINTVLSGYSINGVSVQFGSGWNVMIQSGIAMKKDTYELLKQTGLTDRTLRRWHG